MLWCVRLVMGLYIKDGFNPVNIGAQEQPPSFPSSQKFHTVKLSGIHIPES